MFNQSVLNNVKENEMQRRVAHRHDRERERARAEREMCLSIKNELKKCIEESFRNIGEFWAKLGV